jgi:hypothetical protein
VLVGISVLPSLCLLALFYTETVRLRLVIEDFRVELLTQPLSLGVRS